MVAINGKSSADGSSPGHPLLLESGDSLHARASLRRSERTPQDKPAGFIEVDGVRSVGRAWRAVLLLALVQHLQAILAQDYKPLPLGCLQIHQYQVWLTLA